MAIEIVGEKRIKNLVVHRDVDMEQRHQHFLFALLATLFILSLLFYGWQQYRWRQLGYEIGSLQKKKDDIVEYQKQLILERNSAARDERIDWIARNDLGMVVAAPGQIVTLQNYDFPAPAPAPDAAAAPLTASKR